LISIIPARGGSKGLPDKNVKLLGGQPLIAFTIIAAQRSERIDRVIVSTDSKSIAEIAKHYGAEVPYLRPKSLASDSSMVLDSYLHLIDTLNIREHPPISEFIALLPTVPFRSNLDIDAAIQLYEEKDADSVISMTESTPIEWHYSISKKGRLIPAINTISNIANRQEFTQSVVPNGGLYILQVKKLREHRTYYFENSYPYIMPKIRSIDIDALDDFLLAEVALQFFIDAEK
jgi:CMP-N,N'-diacetyllegionaminic acid synthase